MLHINKLSCKEVSCVPIILPLCFVLCALDWRMRSGHPKSNGRQRRYPSERQANI